MTINEKLNTVKKQIAPLSESLSNYKEVEIIYFKAIENNDNTLTINYNVVCNIDNIADLNKNKKLLATFIATSEILKTHYNNPNSNVRIEYRITTSEEFDRLINDNEAALENANIIYSDNELYTSIINNRNRHKK